jgi:hypothetical protein
MTDYYKILSKNNQLIDLLDSYDKTDNYLLFIYLTCCIFGGYESIDHLIHLLVSNLIKCIKVDLSLYYPGKFDINEKLEETNDNYNFYTNEQKENVNNFLSKLKFNNKIKQDNNNLNIDYILDNTVSLRGFNQKINYGKIYKGNLNVVKSYFINNQDIKIMMKLMTNKEDILKIFKIYFQVPQLMHTYNNYKNNRDALLLQNNFCVNNYKYKKPQTNCTKMDYNHVTNLMTSLINYGDCRELALTLEFYNCLKEWLKYKKYMKDFIKNKNKIIKLIKNQKRLIDINIYFNAYPKKYVDFTKITDFVGMREDKVDFVYKNEKYAYYENHNFVLKMKYKDNKYTYKCNDIMYNKYDKSLVNTKFVGDYIVDGKRPNIIFPYVEFGPNDYKKEILVLGEIEKSLFKNQSYFPNLENKILYLSKPFKIPKNFYKINDFIISREKYYDNLRKKYYGNTNNVEHYKEDSKYLKYFLIEDL